MKTSKLLGYIIFVICCILWGLILVVPWMGFTKGQIAAITAGLVIAGEITFYLSIFLIGKEFLVKLKNKFKFRRNKATKQPEVPENIDHPIP